MLKVCRICLCEIRSEMSYCLMNTVEEQTGFMPIRDKLTLVVPEMALDLVVDPLLCNNCKNSLQIAYDFKQLCLETDKKLHKTMRHCKFDNGCINLSSIIHLLKPKDEVVYIQKITPIQANVKDEIVIDSYSELRNILERHPPSESSPVQRVVININNAVGKVVDTLRPIAPKKEIIITNPSRSKTEYFDSSAMEVTLEEQESSSTTADPGDLIENETEEEELTDEAIQENFIPLIDVGKSKHDTVQSFMCRICTTKLSSKGNLRQHILNHKRSLSHICYVCNRKFKAIHYLKRHEKTHLIDTSSIYKCSQCNKTFKDKVSFKKHSHDVTGEVIKRNKNRNNLPKEAKRIMKKWLYDHQDNPYPTDMEKQELVVQTNLKYIQVENWFVNARRRILNKSRDYFLSNDDSP